MASFRSNWTFAVVDFRVMPPKPELGEALSLGELLALTAVFLLSFFSLGRPLVAYPLRENFGKKPRYRIVVGSFPGYWILLCSRWACQGGWPSEAL